MSVTKSVFNEYSRCFQDCNINKYDMSFDNFQYDLNTIDKNIIDNDIICLVNPDNPTGAFIEYDDMIKILDKCKKLNKLVIFDESFIDFVSKDRRYSLINNEILEKYNNLIVIKSISKSYGIPGLRLGVMATSNEEILNSVKKHLAVWNINSFAEYYLQIANLYKKDYISACDKIVNERERFIEKLRQIKGIDVYNSEANFVLCNLNNYDSTELAIKLLDNNIFIKDLKTKDAFKNQNYIRLAVRTEEENNLLIEEMNKVLRK